VNRVVALLGVFEEDRQLGEPHVPFLNVVFAGNRPQVGTSVFQPAFIVILSM